MAMVDGAVKTYIYHEPINDTLNPITHHFAHHKCIFAHMIWCVSVSVHSHMYVSYKLNPWSWSCRWFCCDDYVLPILLFVIFSMIPQLQCWCVNFMFSYLEIIYEKALCVCSRIHGITYMLWKSIIKCGCWLMMIMLSRKKVIKISQSIVRSYQ